jgi:hypothetical protein
MVDVIGMLSGKWEDGTRPRDLYERIISKSPGEYLPTLLEGIRSPERRVQSGCAELLTSLSEERPELVYPYVDIFVEGLEAPEPVVRWESVATLGNLAGVDSRGVVSRQVDRIAGNLSSGAVLQGHSVRALSKIAMANPEMADSILNELLSAADLFPGKRMGLLIESMERFLAEPRHVRIVETLVRPHAQSEIGVVARKARRVLRLIEQRT